MPLLIVLLALLLPRIVVVWLYLFTDWFSSLFANALWPILGFIFLPTTLLWYTVVQHWFGGQWGIIPVVGLIIALVMDVFPARKRRAIEATA